MALVKCKECGGQVSSNAAACPHCGAPTPPPADDAAVRKHQAQKRATNNALVIAILIVTGLIAVSCIAVGSKSTPRQWTQEDDRSTAVSACKAKIKENAHDPSSVEFPASDQFQVISSQGGSWQLKVSVRAKNGFGALRLVDYLCVVADIKPQPNGGVTYKAIAAPAP